MVTMMRGFIAASVLAFCIPLAAYAQTNLSVAWHTCEQHGKMVGHPSIATGPARWVFAPGYGICEEVQKLIPAMRTEALDPSKVMTDIMLIQRGIADPTGTAK